MTGKELKAGMIEFSIIISVKIFRDRSGLLFSKVFCSNKSTSYCQTCSTLITCFVVEKQISTEKTSSDAGITGKFIRQ